MVIILLVSAVFRFTGLDWDSYDHAHPDERYITWVATSIEWPKDWRTAFDPKQSTFNPYYWPSDAVSPGIVVLQDEARHFAYGHFPLYVGVAATKVAERVGPWLRPFLPQGWLFTQDILNGAEMNEFRHLTAVSRFVTALTDVGTVWVVYLLGRRVSGTAVGLLAAAFLSVNVLHIQLAHFFTVDPFMTFWVVTAVYFMVLSLEESDRGFRQLAHLSLSAVCIGLAVGAKFSAVLLFLPLTLTAYLETAETKAPPSLFSWRGWEKQVSLLGLVAFLAFALTNPFSVLDVSCDVFTDARQIGPIQIPQINWHSCFWDNITRQGAMASGSVDNTFTRQYIDTLPYLYPVEMQVHWGMGLLLGGVAFAGFTWAAGRTVSYFVFRILPFIEKIPYVQHMAPDVSPFTFYTSLILLGWTLPFFLSTGSFYAKFMRYLQPMMPFLMIYAAAFLIGGGLKWWRKVIVGVVLVGTAVYALAFVNMYSTPHPWRATSEWIFRNIPKGKMILTEQWDDALPNSMEVDGVVRQTQEYRKAELNWISLPDLADNEEKLMANLRNLAGADYLVIASNRVYGVVPRLPGRYPISSQYHQLLFDGSLGYEVVLVNGRFPNLFGFYLKPDTFTWPGLPPPSPTQAYLAGFPGINARRADESFLVYDQPLTMIFENVHHKTAEEMYQLFEVK